MDRKLERRVAQDLGGKDAHAATDAVGEYQMRDGVAAGRSLDDLLRRAEAYAAQARDLAVRADRFVRAEPWAGVVIAALSGLVLGHAGGRLGRGKVYVRKAAD